MRFEHKARAHCMALVAEGRFAAFVDERPGQGRYAIVLVPGDAAPPPNEALLTHLPKDMPVTGRLRVPPGRFLGIARQGKVVSWAALGWPRHGAANITVETDIAFRRQGLATQCLLGLCALTNEALVYIVDQANAASLSAATRAGFGLLGYLTYLEETT